MWSGRGETVGEGLEVSRIRPGVGIHDDDAVGQLTEKNSAPLCLGLRYTRHSDQGLRLGPPGGAAPTQAGLGSQRRARGDGSLGASRGEVVCRAAKEPGSAPTVRLPAVAAPQQTSPNKTTALPGAV